MPPEATTAAGLAAAAAPADAAAGPPDARQALVVRYRTAAYLLALQLTGHREDALDIAQDAMLRFFTHESGLRPGQDARPWLLTVVRNLTRDLWRRQRLRSMDSIDSGDLAAELVAPGANPEQTLQRHQAQQRVWRALSTLPIEKREIVVLRDFHDLSYAEIAGVTGIPVGTVMSRLHAARAALRSALERDGKNA